MSVEGRYFYPYSARFIAARVSRPERRLLRFESADGSALGEFRIRKIRVSERLGNIPRRFRLPDGAMFETPDNDGADEMLRGTGRGSSVVDRIERSWGWVLLSVAITLGATYGFIVFGIPALAGELARATPPNIVATVSQKTLQSLDGSLMQPSKLDAATKARANRVFARILRIEPKAAGYHILFRSSPAVGPNAFALPDGEVVVTDQLFPFIKSDAELEGVLAHEVSHAIHRHGLQRIYQASLVPAAIAVATGDASQMGHLTTLVPGVLLQSAYSREFEQQADDDAAEELKADGQDPAALAHLLQRMDAKLCGKDGCGPSWLASHPATADRVNRLMSERAAPKAR
ncbi:MAG: M48 family metallopeptidase [Rhizomicrobium sp.]